MFEEVLIETLERMFWIAIVVVPLLLLVEYLNHRFGDRLIEFFEKRKKFMPFWAGILSMLPGCNAAAAVAVLFSRGYVSLGSLISAILATSDEAIYVFIPAKFNFLPLFFSKLILAVAAGFIIDYISRIRIKKSGNQEVDYCCSHHEHAENNREMVIHSLRHAAKILFFVFLVLFSFNYAKDYFGFNVFAEALIKIKPIQPLAAAFFGLIPGCGTSVVLATLYTEGAIGFSGALAGLSAASGDAVLVLAANKVPARKLIGIIALIFLISVGAGFLVQLF